MVKLALLLLLSGCGGIVQYPSPDLGGHVDVDPDDMDIPSQCLPNTAVCTQSSECCSGSCAFTTGNYPRCGDAVRQESLPIGYYQRGCQWDACGPGPLGGPGPSLDPVEVK